MTAKVFRLSHAQARKGCADYAMTVPDGWICRFSEPVRTLEMNAKFHAICSDIAKSGHMFAGKKRTPAQWKVLLVSGHATATAEGSEIVPGIEGEFVNLRESTALMSKKRGSSLIEYSIAYCAMNGIPLTETQEF